MGGPLLSVIVPTRDRPHLVATAVSSVLGQTRPELEVIVADDCSGPEAAEAVDALADGDERVRVVRAGVHRVLCKNLAQQRDSRAGRFFRPKIKIESARKPIGSATAFAAC